MRIPNYETSALLMSLKSKIPSLHGEATRLVLDAMKTGGTQQKAADILGTYDRSLRLMLKYVPDKDGIVKLGMAAVKKRKKRRAKK